jgi:hypothetical protein
MEYIIRIKGESHTPLIFDLQNWELNAIKNNTSSSSEILIVPQAIDYLTRLYPTQICNSLFESSNEQGIQLSKIIMKLECKLNHKQIYFQDELKHSDIFTSNSKIILQSSASCFTNERLIKSVLHNSSIKCYELKKPYAHSSIH